MRVQLSAAPQSDKFRRDVTAGEGLRIVAKHKLAPYVEKPAMWFKVLNPDYTQKRGRKEMFESFRNHDESLTDQRTRA